MDVSEVELEDPEDVFDVIKETIALHEETPLPHLRGLQENVFKVESNRRRASEIK